MKVVVTKLEASSAVWRCQINAGPMHRVTADLTPSACLVGQVCSVSYSTSQRTEIHSADVHPPKAHLQHGVKSVKLCFMFKTARGWSRLSTMGVSDQCKPQMLHEKRRKFIQQTDASSVSCIRSGGLQPATGNT